MTTRLSTDMIRKEEDWRAFFGVYDTIVLVANSEEQQLSTLSQTLEGKVLFIFFNKIDKVLQGPFERDCLLVARSNTAGSEIVYRKKLRGMMNLLPQPFFKGVANLRTASRERLNRQEDFDGIPAGHLDLADFFERFYPNEHTASSGFGMAVWLSWLVPATKIVLTGFSANRSSKWKVFHVHDWTFEQTALRMMEAGGLVSTDAPGEGNPYPAFLSLFPSLKEQNAYPLAISVLSLRLEKANREIDKLISMTRPLRFFYDGWRAIKWKSKKTRVMEKVVKREEQEKALSGPKV